MIVCMKKKSFFAAVGVSMSIASGAAAADVSPVIPSFGDFVWYTEDVKQNGIPADAQYLYDLSALTGSWKAMMIDQYGDEAYEYTMKLASALIEGTEEDCRLTFDWHRLLYGETGAFIVDDSDDLMLGGAFENGLFDLPDLILPEFYRVDGFVSMDYGIATYLGDDGSVSTVLLTRITPDGDAAGNETGSIAGNVSVSADVSVGSDPNEITDARSQRTADPDEITDARSQRTADPDEITDARSQRAADPDEIE